MEIERSCDEDVRLGRRALRSVGAAGPCFVAMSAAPRYGVCLPGLRGEVQTCPYAGTWVPAVRKGSRTPCQCPGVLTGTSSGAPRDGVAHAELAAVDRSCGSGSWGSRLTRRWAAVVEVATPESVPPGSSAVSLGLEWECKVGWVTCALKVLILLPWL